MNIAIVDLTPKEYPLKIFKELAKNLCEFLNNSGYNAFTSNKIIYKNYKNIILGTTFLRLRKNFLFFSIKNSLPKNTILYNFESYFHKRLWFNKTIKYFYKNYEVWDYSFHNAKNLEKLGIKIRRVLPVIFPYKKNSYLTKKNIDILFVGSLSNRRKKIINQLRNYGLNVFASENIGSPEKLRKLVARSKIFLNIHYYGLRELEQARICPYIESGTIILSEKSLYNDENKLFSKAIVLEDYSNIVKKAVNLLKSDSDLNFLSKKAINFKKKIKTEILLKDTFLN
jgi:hypothetical protein